jgi:hypothetical protein
MDLTAALSGALGGLVTGGFAIGSLFVNARLARQRDEKERSMTAILAAIDAVYQVKRVFDPRRFGEQMIQGKSELDAALDELGRRLIPLGYPALRKRFTFILDALAYTTAIQAFGDTSEIFAGRRLCDHAVELLEAVLHHNKLPDEPRDIAGFRAAITEANEVASEPYSWTPDESDQPDEPSNSSHSGYDDPRAEIR